MRLGEILANLAKWDILIAAEGDQLHLDGPAGSLTDELKALLLEHKPLLLDFLRQQKATLGDLSTDEREAFEERSAIMEFDGGLSREEAERLARSISNRQANPNQE